MLHVQVPVFRNVHDLVKFSALLNCVKSAGFDSETNFESLQPAAVDPGVPPPVEVAGRTGPAWVAVAILIDDPNGVTGKTGRGVAVFTGVELGRGDGGIASAVCVC